MNYDRQCHRCGFKDSVPVSEMYSACPKCERGEGTYTVTSDSRHLLPCTDCGRDSIVVIEKNGIMNPYCQLCSHSPRETPAHCTECATKDAEILRLRKALGYAGIRHG